jgi:hypothetical protein
MASIDLSKRDNWQTESGEKAAKTEHLIINILREHIANKYSNLRFTGKPKFLNNIYKNTQLDENEITEIHNASYKSHGIIPEFLIVNTETNKSIIGEIKRQDGWIEGGKPKDGRGNADERLGKYFFPGVMKIIREKTNQHGEVIPIFAIFDGNITRDPKQVRKLRTFFTGYENNLFLYRRMLEGYTEKLINHFDRHIIPMLG